MELVVITKEDLKTIIDESVNRVIALLGTKEPKQYVSRTEAAKQIGVSTWMIDKLCRTGKLSKHKVGSKPVIKQSDIDKLIIGK